MGFRLVPKSVTLNDVERCHSPILHYFTEFDSFGGRFTVKVVEDRTMMSVASFHFWPLTHLAARTYCHS